MRQFARTALALLAAAGLWLGGQGAGGQAKAAPIQALSVGPATGSSPIAKAGSYDHYGYRYPPGHRGHHRFGRYDCSKIRHGDGAFDLYCRRQPLIKKYLCDRQVDGPDWRMRCRPIWVRPDRWPGRHHGYGHEHGYGRGHVHRHGGRRGRY